MSTPSPRMAAIIVRARDFERSVRFYREVVRLPLVPGRNDAEGDPWIGGAHAELSWREGAYLHFAVYPANDACPPGAGTELGFHLAEGDDLDDAVARARAFGATVAHPPRPEPWGRTARLVDPDGNLVGLTARVG